MKAALALTLAGVVAVAAGAFHRGRSLRARLAAAEHAATHDPLTGLANRAGLTQRAEQVAARRVLVVLVDLDAFKLINDTLGHQAGDEVLRVVAARLDRMLSPFGTVARLGGDEFAAILNLAMACEETAGWTRTALIRAANAVAVPLPVAGRVVSVRVSIGAALHTGREPFPAALHRADAAMYRAKRAGQPVALFDPAHDTDEPAARPASRSRDTAAPAARLREAAA